VYIERLTQIYRGCGEPQVVALGGLMQGRAQDIGKEGILEVDVETGIKAT
jgi:hypothetical protein